MTNNSVPAVVLVLTTLLLGVMSQGAVAAQDFRERINGITLDASAIESDVMAEVEFGREVAARILGRYRLHDAKKLTHYINLVGTNLVRYSGRDELNYKFALLDTPEINAYSAPGGYIFVTRGALSLMRDESELAAVLAHEIAHVTQKHIVKELDIYAADNSAEAGLAALLGGFSDPARVAFIQALDKAVALLLDTGLNAKDEFEADSVGATMATTAGYDASALSRYLERLKSVKGESMGALERTHPSFSKRLVSLKMLLDEEGMTALAGATLSSRFTAYLNP